jgi:hypothetical protein
MIDYTIGNEHDPGDPFGRIALHIDLDGAAKLEHFSRTGVTTWEGQVEATVLKRIMAALDVAGFPAVPQHSVIPGSAIRRLSVQLDGEVQGVLMPDSLGSELDGYKEAFAILDALAVQLTGGTYKGAKDTLEPSVANVRAR